MLGRTWRTSLKAEQRFQRWSGFVAGRAIHMNMEVLLTKSVLWLGSVLGDDQVTNYALISQRRFWPCLGSLANLNSVLPLAGNLCQAIPIAARPTGEFCPSSHNLYFARKHGPISNGIAALAGHNFPINRQYRVIYWS